MSEAHIPTGERGRSEEFVELEFLGFTSHPINQFANLSRALVSEFKRGRISTEVPLIEIVQKIVELKSPLDYELSGLEPCVMIHSERGLRLIPVREHEASSERFLKEMKKKSSRRKEFRFTYGEDNSERVALTTKLFLWGFRASTPDGYRNFSWAKTHVLDFQREEPLSRFSIDFVSFRRGPLRIIRAKLSTDPLETSEFIVLKRRLIFSY